MLEWLRELLGLPPGTEGVLLSGGSMANITALAAARHAQGPGVVYVSDQTHASIARGLRHCGSRPRRCGCWPRDDAFRLDPGGGRRGRGGGPRGRAAARVRRGHRGHDELRRRGPAAPRWPTCARREGMWLHVDGAYGAPAALCAQGRAALRGLERADSLVLDPHKWLFSPYDVGCLLVRRPGVLAGPSR